MSFTEADRRIYFPGLNALRFYAAISVVLGHIEQFKGLMGLTDGTPESRFFLWQLAMPGSDAVILFFVISGFLITYLLLAEQGRTDTINIPKFYVRRILRIWPVYYLTVGMAFFVVSAIVSITGYAGYYDPIEQDFVPKLVLFLIFLPNIAAIRGYFPVGATHLWTIGIEEQFYLMWPLLLKRFHKAIVPCLVVIILLKALVTVLFHIHFDLRQYMPSQPEGVDRLLIFLAQFRIETMAIGGLAAYIVFRNKRRVLSVIFHPVAEKIILTTMLVHVLFIPSTLPGANTIVQGIVSHGVYILYALFILNASCNPNSTIKLENRVLDYLGRLSYGIYAYHIVIIYLALVALDRAGIPFNNTFTENLILYTVVIGLTLGAAAASYRWYESAFLRLKARFSVVRSATSMDAVEGERRRMPNGLAASIAHRPGGDD